MALLVNTADAVPIMPPGPLFLHATDHVYTFYRDKGSWRHNHAIENYLWATSQSPSALREHTRMPPVV